MQSVTISSAPFPIYRPLLALPANHPPLYFLLNADRSHRPSQHRFAPLENKASAEIGGNKDLVFNSFLHEFLDAAKGVPIQAAFRYYRGKCGMGGRIARPGQRFSDAGPLTLLAALSTGNHMIYGS